MPFPHRNRILLSGLWRNQSGMCSLSGTFSDILFETSVCTVCSSTLRVVLLSQTIERLSHHKLPLAMHYKDRYLWIGLAILIINVW